MAVIIPWQMVDLRNDDANKVEPLATALRRAWKRGRVRFWEVGYPLKVQCCGGSQGYGNLLRSSGFMGK